jgi:hypothetical protein
VPRKLDQGRAEKRLVPVRRTGVAGGRVPRKLDQGRAEKRLVPVREGWCSRRPGARGISRPSVAPRQPTSEGEAPPRRPGTARSAGASTRWPSVAGRAAQWPEPAADAPTVPDQRGHPPTSQRRRGDPPRIKVALRAMGSVQPATRGARFTLIR